VAEKVVKSEEVKSLMLAGARMQSGEYLSRQILASASFENSGGEGRRRYFMPTTFGERQHEGSSATCSEYPR